MTPNRRFDSALQALSELKTETPATPPTPAPAAPALTEVLAKLGPIPAEALFLGIASDGLPVLLNLHDPHPGPMLVIGDPGAGKTAFLHTIAQSVAQTHAPKDVQLGIITNYPEEWERTATQPHRRGVFPIGHTGVGEYLHSLVEWAHANKNSSESVLLLVDDLESIATLDAASVQDFRWLLLRGPARRVWPIVTLNAIRHGQVTAWLQNFRTRIFGRIGNGRVAQAVGGDSASAFDQLEARIQFSLRERQKWLRFWLPSC